MTISATTQGLRPGVCTSTSRPSTPFTGQLIFETDTNRLAVWNGTSWVFLADADTPSGLQMVKAETSFSAASSITVDNVFTSEFRNYSLLVNFTTSSTGVLNLRLRSGGTSAATNYNYIQGYFLTSSAAAATATSQTSFLIGGDTNGSFLSVANVLVAGPNVAQPTILYSQNPRHATNYTSPQLNLIHGSHTTSSAYDGFEMLTSSGTATGTYTVYGYRNS